MPTSANKPFKQDQFSPAAGRARCRPVSLRPGPLGTALWGLRLSGKVSEASLLLRAAESLHGVYHGPPMLICSEGHSAVHVFAASHPALTPSFWTWGSFFMLR